MLARPKVPWAIEANGSSAPRRGRASPLRGRRDRFPQLPVQICHSMLVNHMIIMHTLTRSKSLEKAA